MADRVGFIGVGEMGFPMAWNLLKSGHKLAAYDILESPLAELRKLGAEICKAPREAARDSDVIIIMVRTMQQVEDVVTGEDGVLSGAREGSTVLIMSTIDPRAIKRMEGLAGSQGVAVLDCPVSGAKHKAEAGTLTIMAGGSEDAFTAVRPLLEVLGQNIFYLGESGMGEAAKLVNNLLLLVHMNAAYEAMALANKAGVRIDALTDLIRVSTGGSWVVDNWDIVKSWKENYQEGGTMDLIYKDIDITLAYGEALKVPLHLSSLAKQLGRY